MKVVELVLDHRVYGWSPEELHFQHPHLSLGQIHSALAYSWDDNVPSSITNGLRVRGVDVITAYEDGANKVDDATLLDRALALSRILFTRDEDFLVEAARRQQLGIPWGRLCSPDTYIHRNVCRTT